MVDTKVLLFKAISLLYLEASMPNVRGKSNGLIEDLMAKIALPDNNTDTEGGRNGAISLIETTRWLLKVEEAVDHSQLMGRIKMGLSADPIALDSFEILNEYKDLDDEERFSLARQIWKELSRMGSEIAIKEIIKKAYQQVFYGVGAAADVTNVTSNMIEDLTAHSRALTSTQRSFVIDSMSINDPESLKTVLARVKEDLDGKGGFKTGIQALNRMFGETGQLRRGMTVLVGGLTHNYKSGFVSDLFRHFCLYNDPVLRDETKKPMLLFISAENRLEEDIMRMYVALKSNEYREAVSTENLDIDEVAEYVTSRLGARGWHVEFLRVDGTQTNYTKLTSAMLDFEDRGYEIQAMCLDYLALLDRSDIHGGNMMGEDLRKLVHNMRLWCSARDILFVTPHQLSGDALQAKKMGETEIHTAAVGNNWWDASKRIANEVDMEIYVHIVYVEGVAYLGVARGKHRTIKPTPMDDRSFLIPFSKIGYIMDDIDGEDTSLKSVDPAKMAGPDADGW